MIYSSMLKQRKREQTRAERQKEKRKREGEKESRYMSKGEEGEDQNKWRKEKGDRN